MPQDRYEAWAEDRREGLRRLRLRLLVELAGLCEESADPESAIEALVRAVADDPTDEEAQAGLVRLYAFPGGDTRRYCSTNDSGRSAAKNAAPNRGKPSGAYPMRRGPGGSRPPVCPGKKSARRKGPRAQAGTTCPPLRPASWRGSASWPS